MGNLKQDKILERQGDLQNYLDNLLGEPLVPTLQEIIEFFEISKHWKDIKNNEIMKNNELYLEEQQSPTYENNTSQVYPTQEEQTINAVEYSMERISISNNEAVSSQNDMSSTRPSIGDSSNNESINTKQYIAIRDHVAKDETELSFKAGDLIEVTNNMQGEDCYYWFVLGI